MWLQLFNFSSLRRTVIGGLIAFATLIAAAGCGSKPAVTAGNTGTDNTANDRGREIVGEYLKRDGAPFRKTRFRFTINEEGEAAKIYEVDTWRKQSVEGTTTLLMFVSPPEDAGTGTLTVEAPGKKSVVVTYSQARDEFRESDTKKAFFGGLTAGELLGEWDKFDFRFVGEKTVDGVKALEVDGKLKPGADSAVARIGVVFRSDNYVPLETHIFASDGTEVRTYRTTAIKDDPAHPYAQRIEVENKVYKSRTTIEVVNRDFPATIEDSMFSREKLKASVRK